MLKRSGAFALTMLMLVCMALPAQAALLGPARSYEELTALAGGASAGDTLLVAGEIAFPAGGVLSVSPSVSIRPAQGETAAIRGLRIESSDVRLYDMTLLDSLTVRGSSTVELTGVTVSGAPGAHGVSFTGSGALIVDPSCSITGGSEAAGVSLSHTGGDLYVSLEGSIAGGSGATGGPGVLVSPLGNYGAMMIAGSIAGGEGTIAGGQALNLFDLQGNAFVTVDGTLTGGGGVIGGDGVQVISAGGFANIGIVGSVSGGDGESYGGDAVMLMNAGDSSTIYLSGTLSGGDALAYGAQPGSALLIVGKESSFHTHMVDCALYDGRALASEPEVTPLPELTASIEDSDLLMTPEPPAQEATPSEPLPPDAPLATPAPPATPDEASGASPLSPDAAP